MKRVTILDRDPSTGALAFGLEDILLVLGADAAESTWTLKDVECIGGMGAERLHRASDSGQLLMGGQLIDLAADLTHVIDGEFCGQLHDTVWITIRAVDSAAYQVETEREAVVAALRARFTHVEDR